MVESRHRWTWASAAAIAMAASITVAAEEHVHGAGQSPAQMWQQMRARDQTLAVAVAFDGAGRLYRARVGAGHVVVDHSDDLGASFSAPVVVNPAPEPIEGEGDGRPKIAIADDGAIYVSYTRMLDRPFSGDVRFSRSGDGGRSFSEPLTVNDDREVIGHRRDTLLAGPDGRVYIFWLDRRDEAAARKKGEPYAGAAVYYAVSRDRGASFSPNVRLVDHACECCRIAAARGAGGAPAVFWRHIYEGNERDHAFVLLDGRHHPVRVSDHRWRIEACPHHGPSLSVDAQGVYHLAWFDNAEQARGLFYARSPDGERFSPPMAFGDVAAQPGHPDVISVGREVVLAWKQFDGERASAWIMRSEDGGGTWSVPLRVGDTADASDHPLLAARKGRIFLSWNTADEGFRLFAIDEVSK